MGFASWAAALLLLPVVCAAASGDIAVAVATASCELAAFLPPADALEVPAVIT